MIKRTFFAVLLCGAFTGFGAPITFAANCPAAGNAHSVRVRALNMLKNRATAPKPSQIDHSATLKAILAPGDDYSRWDDAKGAEIVGYVVDVRPGGVETANCRARDLANRDTHIEIALSPYAPESARMIVEVTPRWRRKMALAGVNWNTRHLERVLTGKRVVIRGWLMFDREHADQSENTSPDRIGDWRATAWEIHPVTRIALEPLR